MRNSGLWKRSFGLQEPGLQEPTPSVTLLIASLDDVRAKTAQLTSRIQDSLPGLTVHAVTHLDALWEVAEVIAGKEFAFNPLEAYIFGCAVLLHDAALCFEAYRGGQAAVRETVCWKDAHARLSNTTSSIPGNLLEEADFEALRNLHATQARTIATEAWECPDSEPVFLIDNPDLRQDYGELIGAIASSHHWRIETVVDRFSVRRPAAAHLDTAWEIDALKIACLLRVADAGHIDAARAPSFLFRLLQMNAVSRAHWVAQNRLGRLHVKFDDQSQLVIASTKPFSSAESAAWWVAFDAIALFDKELKDSNEALVRADHGPRTPFARRGVAGAGNVRELATYVETAGWEPTESSVHVSDVAALVSRLGGEALYGDTGHFDIALRELVQNAADAVIARRALAGGRYKGRIDIRLLEDSSGSLIFQVDDDGVGMSQITLSEDLVDFGKSFWVSRRALDEFPGLLASGFSPKGQFGVGFFSIFMASNRVRVFSRRYDRSLEDVRCISFERGLSLRPTLSRNRPTNLGMDCSTRVELELKTGAIRNPDEMEVQCNLQGHTNFHVQLRNYVASMVCGIDVPIFFEWKGEVSQIQDQFPPNQETLRDWLETLSYVNTGVNQRVKKELESAVPRLREVRQGNTCFGVAAISLVQGLGCDFLSAKAVGGLVIPHNRYQEPFTGLIEYFPRTAKREAGEIAVPRNCLVAWLEEQVEILKSGQLAVAEAYSASYSLCELGHDPIEMFPGMWVLTEQGVEFVPVNNLSWYIRTRRRLGFKVSHWGSRLEYIGEHVTVSGVSTCIIYRNGKFNEAKILNDRPENPRSLVGVVHRTLETQGESPKWTTNTGRYSGPFGRCDGLEVLLDGENEC